MSKDALMNLHFSKALQVKSFQKHIICQQLSPMIRISNESIRTNGVVNQDNKALLNIETEDETESGNR